MRVFVVGKLLTHFQEHNLRRLVFDILPTSQPSPQQLPSYQLLLVLGEKQIPPQGCQALRDIISSRVVAAVQVEPESIFRLLYGLPRNRLGVSRVRLDPAKRLLDSDINRNRHHERDTELGNENLEMGAPSRAHMLRRHVPL